MCNDSAALSAVCQLIESKSEGQKWLSEMIEQGEKWNIKILKKCDQLYCNKHTRIYKQKGERGDKEKQYKTLWSHNKRTHALTALANESDGIVLVIIIINNN